LTFLNLIDLINLAGSVPAGQPLLHGASWHSRHLAASSIAVLGVNPATASAVYSDFTTLLNFYSSLRHFASWFIVKKAAFFGLFIKSDKECS
jgi:hypothetical protein